MKFILVFLLLFLVVINTSIVWAEEPVPVPTPSPAVQHTNEFTVQNEPNAVISVINGFAKGFDSILGGFVFFTPDPLADKIVLKDNSEIPGVTKYRNMFFDISIPLLAIVISAIAFIKIGSDDVQHLRSFAKRFLVTIVLFITMPFILSYSIQFNNLLVKQVSTTQELSGFITNYFDQAQTQINAGQNPEQYGIPEYDISLLGGIFKSLGKFVVQIFLFILTFLFLLGGIMYIGFQFVIRYATLLFLAVIYPIIIPFALSEKTDHIVRTFFKSWFTFLIQQPAFVLGFAIATDIFNALLKAKGPSIGLLFFYTGFLFFLAGLNVLVGRLFGSGWEAMSVNFQAMVASRSFAAPAQSSFRDFKRELIGGNGSMSHKAGDLVHDKIASLMPKKPDQNQGNGNSSNGGNSGSTTRPGNGFVKMQPTIPEFSKELNEKGLQARVVNDEQGVVSLSGEAYQYHDKTSGLTSVYPTRVEALQDGVPEDKLEKVQLDNAHYIDLSTFDAHHPNPHNLNAMEQAQKHGKEDIHYAFVQPYSPPARINNFLELSEGRNTAYGIKGVIAKRQGVQTGDHIIRLYSKKSYEKRKNI